VLAVRDELIKERADVVQEFTSMLVEAGRFIYQRPDTAAEIGVSFLDPNRTLGLKAAILKDVLKESNGIRTNDLFPVAEDFERIQKYMVEEMGIGSPIDLKAFIDPRFAEIACKGQTAIRRRSAMKDISAIARGIMNRQEEDVSTKTMLGREGKYLFFTLEGQEYGIGIFSVREVIRMMAVRSVPNLPEFIKGVINLRGKVIPLVDLRSKFGLAEAEWGERTCFIVLEILAADASSFLAAIVVDSVSEVMNIKAKDIENSVFIGDVNTDYILGMAKMGTGVKILLNAGRLFTESESSAVSAIA
jgi:chemotaxis signal transduction protein